MTIDLKILKPGGKVDLTFKDGSKVVDAKLYSGGLSSCTTSGPSLTIFPNGCFTVVHSDGVLNTNIASVDAYTPPEPSWAAHRFCLAGGTHVWERTSDGLWWCVSEKQDKMSTEELDGRYDGWIVALVVEKGEPR